MFSGRRGTGAAVDRDSREMNIPRCTRTFLTSSSVRIWRFLLRFSHCSSEFMSSLIFRSHSTLGSCEGPRVRGCGSQGDVACLAKDKEGGLGRGCENGGCVPRKAFTELHSGSPPAIKKILSSPRLLHGNISPPGHFGRQNMLAPIFPGEERGKVQKDPDGVDGSD